jgi:ribonuclease P protein component
MAELRKAFQPTARVRHRSDFQAVFATRRACRVGPLVIHAGPTTTGRCRIGLALSRKVGNSPRRNRIKRMLREAFRHVQHDMPPNIDLVVVVRAHEPRTAAAYTALLQEAVGRLGLGAPNNGPQSDCR